MRAWLRPSVALAVAFLLLPLGTSHAQRDHYNEYDFEVHPTSSAPPFGLRDQWGSSKHSFAVYDRFLIPTEQSEDPILDPDAYLTRYFIGFGGEPLRTLSVSNKFGPDQTWVIGESAFLLNPSLKNQAGGEIPALNHYKCYIVESGPDVSSPEVLSDQVGSYTVTVHEPAVWCNPAEKTVDGATFPITDEFAWIGCYFTTPPSFFTPPVQVSIQDQFGTITLDLASREVLCVPSQKAVPVPVEPKTWGGVKAVFR